MSGHSKWSKVKHQKATTDKAKSAVFTRATRGIIISVRESGGISDPANNFHLRLAIEKARNVNMPKENIERAIEKAKGQGGEGLTQELYEGYGPFGVALLIYAATDNNKRTVSFVKQLLEHAGGSMASPNAVSYLFSKKGVIIVEKKKDFDTVFECGVDAGALDVVETEECYEVYARPEETHMLKEYFEQKGIQISDTQIVMQPTTTLRLQGDEQKQIEDLITHLEELDDVMNVYSNMEQI